MGCCSPSQNTTTSTVKLPKWASEAGQSNYQTAQDIAARPYQAYGGDKVADLTGRQSTALSLLDNIAPSAITTGKTGFDLSRVSEYMNPFTDEVINRAASDIARGGQVAGENMDNAFIPAAPSEICGMACSTQRTPRTPCRKSARCHQHAIWCVFRRIAHAYDRTSIRSRADGQCLRLRAKSAWSRSCRAGAGPSRNRRGHWFVQ
jgi:hypothetical protein